MLDCANGATYRVGPEIFRRLGATVSVVGAEPDGRNINDGVGSTHVEALAAAVAAGGQRAGFAFDGDGDRVLAVDGEGGVVDGDELIALAALHLRAQERLGGGVAVTVMTNYGFHAAMREAGVEVATTAVGDRYVLEALRERGWALGGEQSGHIIDMGFVPSGDGIASALLTLEALAGAELAERSAMTQAAADARQRARRRQGASDGRRGRRGGERGRGTRGTRTRPGARERYRGARARDGRGAERGGGARGLRASRRARRGRGGLSGRPGRVQRARSTARPGCGRTIGPLSRSLPSPAMCGIVGYVGNRAAQELLLAGLRKLEYRGYDSAGVSVMGPAVDRLGARGRQPRPARRGDRPAR